MFCISTFISFSNLTKNRINEIEDGAFNNLLSIQEMYVIKYCIYFTELSQLSLRPVGYNTRVTFNGSFLFL